MGVLAGISVASTLLHLCGQLSDQIGVGLRGWVVRVTSGRCCPARGDGQLKKCFTLSSRFLLRHQCTAQHWAVKQSANHLYIKSREDCLDHVGQAWLAWIYGLIWSDMMQLQHAVLPESESKFKKMFTIQTEFLHAWWIVVTWPNHILVLQFEDLIRFRCLWIFQTATWWIKWLKKVSCLKLRHNSKRNLSFCGV